MQIKISKPEYHLIRNTIHLQSALTCGVDVLQRVYDVRNETLVGDCIWIAFSTPQLDLSHNMR